jgi:hypothetical protein
MSAEQELIDVDITIKSYAPKVFSYIREIDGIEEYDIMKSVMLESNKMQIFKTNNNESHGTGGKSGSFFFFTQDR